MSPVFPARRRAEEFAALVETSTGPGDARSEELARFLEVVESLRTAPPVQARPEFVASLREQLMTAAETDLVAAATPAEARLTLPARRPRDRRLAAAVGGLAIVGATTSMAVAAQSALPGDTLYPLKRAIENVQTGIAVDEGERGVDLLATAEVRLEEIEDLSREGRLDEPDIAADTFNTFSDQSIEASDLLLSEYDATGEQDLITQLHEFTSESLDTLVELEAVIPAEARDELLRAAMVLRAIDLEATQACPQCAGGIVEFPAVLQSAQKAIADAVASPEDEAVPSATGSKGPRPDQGKQDPQPKPAGDEGPEGEGPDLGGVLQPPQGPDQQPEGGDDQETSSDPIGDLTGTLTEGDQQTTGNNSGGLPELPEADEAVDGVLDPVAGSGGSSDQD